MHYNVVLASIGEIAVKGVYTRRRMQKAILENIKKALQRWGIREYSINIEGGLIYVRNVNDINRVIASLKHVFGLEKVTPAYEIEFQSLDDLALKVAEIYKNVISGKKFRVTARRTGQHNFTSIDAMRRIGSVLRELGGIVDLENYELEVSVYIRDDRAYTFTKSYSGLGGLPEGNEDKILALISGGFDSPVAAWMLMKRGGLVDYVFFNIGGEEQKRIVYDICCTLYCLYVYGRDQLLWDIEFRWIFPLLNEVPMSIRGVYLKKAMYMAAEKIARKDNYKALCTGESLSQVSSQTLNNLVVTEEGIGVPILRPLVGMDKKEIVNKSREIDTYNISSQAKEFCALATPHPSTKVNPVKLNTYLEKTRLLEVLDTMLETTTRKISLSQKCLCDEIIERRYQKIRKYLN